MARCTGCAAGAIPSLLYPGLATGGRAATATPLNFLLNVFLSSLGHRVDTNSELLEGFLLILQLKLRAIELDRAKLLER